MPPAAPTPPRPTARFYQADRYTPEESVGFLMKRIMNSMIQQADRRLRHCDLTNAQWGPLMRLHRGGDATVAELARWLQLDAGSTTRLLDRLEKKGLVRRIRSTTDRRMVHVSITQPGRDAVSEVPAVMAEVLNLHLAGFSQQEWQTLKDLLTRMAATGELLRDMP